MGFFGFAKALFAAQPALRGNMNISETGSVHSFVAPALFQPQVSSGIASVCTPLWAINGSECPYGKRLPGDVTLPDYDKAKRLGYPLNPEISSKTVLYIAVAYSYFDYVLAFFAFLSLLWHRGTAELHFILYLAFLTFMNEVVLKKQFSQRRPFMSCLTSCGLPSGHSVIAIGTLIHFVMYAFLTVRTRHGAEYMLELCPGGDELKKYCPEHIIIHEPGRHSERTRFYKRSARSLLNKIRIFVDSTASVLVEYFDEPSEYDIAARLVLWTLFIAPVPLSRVQLSDHSPWQVFVGTIVGSVLAGMWLSFARGMQRRFNHKLGQKDKPACMLYFEHNYALPCQHVISDVQSYLKKKDHQGSTGQIKKMDIVNYVHQINWYQMKTLKRYSGLTQKKGQTERKMNIDEDCFLKVRWITLQTYREKILSLANRWDVDISSEFPCERVDNFLIKDSEMFKEEQRLHGDWMKAVDNSKQSVATKIQELSQTLNSDAMKKYEPQLKDLLKSINSAINNFDEKADTHTTEMRKQVERNQDELLNKIKGKIQELEEAAALAQETRDTELNAALTKIKADQEAAQTAWETARTKKMKDLVSSLDEFNQGSKVQQKDGLEGQVKTFTGTVKEERNETKRQLESVSELIQQIKQVAKEAEKVQELRQQKYAARSSDSGN